MMTMHVQLLCDGIAQQHPLFCSNDGPLVLSVIIPIVRVQGGIEIAYFASERRCVDAALC